MSVTVTITVFCKEHPKYKGTRLSSRSCLGCEDVYYILHPEGILPDCQIEKVEVHSAQS